MSAPSGPLLDLYYTSVDAVTERLQRTIDQAKEVTEELRRLGF